MRPQITTNANSDPEIAQNAPSRGTGPTLTYNPKLRRVRVSFSRSDCLARSEPPADLIARAEARMKAAQAAGQVEHYVVHHDRLKDAWKALASSDGQIESITLTLAAGAPSLPGLELEPSSEPGCLALMTIEDDAPGLSEWRREWLELHVEKFLEKVGAKGRLNPALLHATLLRAKAGAKIARARIVAIDEEKDGARTGNKLIVSKKRGEVMLRLGDVKALSTPSEIEERLARIEEATRRLEGDRKGHYRILRQDILEAIETACAGPQALELDLPLFVLAAVDLSHDSVEESPGKPQQATHAKAPVAQVKTPATQPQESTAPPKGAAMQPKAASPPKKSLVSAHVKAGGMCAEIGDVHPSVFTMGDLQIEWLEQELRTLGIVHGLIPERLQDAIEAIKRGESPKGLVVAEGSSGTAGKSPYLHVVTGEETGNVDLRSYKKRAIARAGQIVAEIRYSAPGNPGIDVRGNPLPPPAGEPLDVQIGEGIEQAEPGRFKALFDGVVVLEGTTKISLTKLLLHEGDVNLTTGDISFDGPVEITGDVDSGVQIHVGGDLIVRGEVRRARIFCRGNVTVMRGIVTGSEGWVNTKGDIKADFIENSRIRAGGTVTANKSIMQCQVIAGDNITCVDSSGLIGGGSFTCGKGIATCHLGLPDGTKTEVTCGVDVKSEFTIQVRSRRLERLEKAHELDRQAFRELSRKPVARLGRSDRQKKDLLRDRLARWGDIVERARANLESVLDKRSYDTDARIQVSGKLAANCSIKIAGKAVPLREEAMSVVITPNEVDGSYLRPYTK